MTISINNISSDACLICHEDYTSGEREDTAKVVELACHHFYHLDCISPWLALNENTGQDLSCCYQCEASLLPKRFHPAIINSEVVEERFAEIEQNPNFGSRPEVINCLAHLKRHSNSIANLLKDIAETEGNEHSFERFQNWIIANVQEESRSVACLLINEVLQGGQVLQSLEQEIKYLATLPITERYTEIKEEGVPVYYGEGTDEFRMRVSKDYLQRATCAYLYENIHNIEQFEGNLAVVGEVYAYDQEVLDAIEDARNLHKTISDTIKENASLPIDKIILPIHELMEKTQLSENSKRTIPLIINEILLQRGALRTFHEEIDRWAKEPVEKCPEELKQNGTYYIDRQNTVKHLNAEEFIGWVKATYRAKRTFALANEIKTSLIRNTVGFLAAQFFNSVG